MKKIIYSVFAAAVALTMLCSCLSVDQVRLVMDKIADHARSPQASSDQSASAGGVSSKAEDFHIDPNGEGETAFSKELEDGVLVLVNAERSGLALSPLSEDSDLKDTAQIRCKEMMENDYFEHTRPDGREWVTVIEEKGYSYTIVSENIQMGRAATITAQEIFDSWKGSPPHYAAMIADDVTRTGIGVYVRKSKQGYEWYAAEHFSAPY